MMLLQTFTGLWRISMSMVDEKLGLERIVFFSDAVMAIAITLLVIDIKVPEIDPGSAALHLPDYLSETATHLLTFLISFAVIGIYWAAHHRYFGFIQRYDTPLIALNLVFLFFIACMPFVASLLGRHASVPAAVVAYTLTVAALGASLAGIWWYATHGNRLVDPELDRSTIRITKIRLLAGTLVFLLAAPLAFIGTTAAMTAWWLSPLIVFGAMRLVRVGNSPR
jgi:uncharacterized membrane protein